MRTIIIIACLMAASCGSDEGDEGSGTPDGPKVCTNAAPLTLTIEGMVWSAVGNITDGQDVTIYVERTDAGLRYLEVWESGSLTYIQTNPWQHVISNPGFCDSYEEGQASYVTDAGMNFGLGYLAFYELGEPSAASELVERNGFPCREIGPTVGISRCFSEEECMDVAQWTDDESAQVQVALDVRSIDRSPFAGDPFEAAPSCD